MPCTNCSCLSCSLQNQSNSLLGQQYQLNQMNSIFGNPFQQQIQSGLLNAFYHYQTSPLYQQLNATTIGVTNQQRNPADDDWVDQTYQNYVNTTGTSSNIGYYPQAMTTTTSWIGSMYPQTTATSSGTYLYTDNGR